MSKFKVGDKCRLVEETIFIYGSGAAQSVTLAQGAQFDVVDIDSLGTCVCRHIHNNQVSLEIDFPITDRWLEKISEEKNYIPQLDNWLKRIKT
jgi:hypothetical protein